MEDLKALFDALVQIMKVPFTLWGFTLNFWDILLCLLVGGVIIYLVGRFLF